MTSVRADAEALVERTTSAQGLPLRIDDPSILARVAAIISTARDRAAA